MNDNGARFVVVGSTGFSSTSNVKPLERTFGAGAASGCSSSESNVNLLVGRNASGDRAPVGGVGGRLGSEGNDNGAGAGGGGAAFAGAGAGAVGRLAAGRGTGSLVSNVSRVRFPLAFALGAGGGAGATTRDLALSDGRSTGFAGTGVSSTSKSKLMPLEICT